MYLKKTKVFQMNRFLKVLILFFEIFVIDQQGQSFEAKQLNILKILKFGIIRGLSPLNVWVLMKTKPPRSKLSI